MYKDLMIYVDWINNAIFRWVSSFYTWEWLKILLWDQDLVEKINKKYRSFYWVILQDTKDAFFTQLGILFDKDKRSISLYTLIDFLKSNKEKITKEEFEKNNVWRYNLQGLVESYTWIWDTEIEEIEILFLWVDSIREKVYNYRSQYIAHKDKEPSKISITWEEIIKLYTTIAKILNIISHVTSHNIFSYSHLENICKQEVKQLFSSH